MIIVANKRHSFYHLEINFYINSMHSFVLWYLMIYFLVNKLQDVHTSLMKMYSENRSSDLLKLVQKSYQGYPTDTVETLQTFGRFHALAIYYQHNTELEKALNLWSR